MFHINDRLRYSINIFSQVLRKSRHSKTVIILCLISIFVIYLYYPFTFPKNHSVESSTNLSAVTKSVNISSNTVQPVITNSSAEPIPTKSANNTKANQVEITHTNAYITSAYYYEKSKSLGENAIAMVVVMSQKTFYELQNNPRLSIITTRGEKSLESKIIIKKETTTKTACEYIMTLVQSTAVSNPEKIEFHSHGVRVEVPFRRPRSHSPSPVVMCIAPQFVSEKWQLFLMNILVMRRYGGHMHIYITSMVEEMFNTLKVFEKWGSLTIDFWMRMKFHNASLPFVNPNGSVEWRNQAGAQTDCLLQYKEAADFIAFMDIDEILIPRNSHNYHQEFTSHFSAFPDYHSIFYQKRDVTIKRVKNVTNFNFGKLFSTMELSNITEYGKSVVDPKKYNSTWIHHSFQLPLNRIYKVINTEIIHIKHISEKELDKNPPFKLSKMFGTYSDLIISETDLSSLDRDFNATILNNHFRSAAIKMFDHNFYSPIVFECYNKVFYYPYFNEKKSFDVLCPNADLCVLPQKSNIKCVHSDATYVSGPEMSPITFHYAIQPFWSKDIGCYQ